MTSFLSNRIATEEGDLDRMYANDTLLHLEQLLSQTRSLQTLQQHSDDAAKAARDLRSKSTKRRCLNDVY